MSVSASLRLDGDVDERRQSYRDKCQRLQEQLNAQSADEGSVSLKKRSSNLFRHRGKNGTRIDVRDFCDVLSVDVDNMVAEIEGMTPYDKIVAETMKQRFLPTVVPELKSITIGGALSGVGIESSSFRYGLVHETIEEFDVLLSDGDIVTCRPDNEYRDLFFAFPNSYGSLGYALRVVVKLVPVKKNVRLAHQHFYKPEVMFEKLQEICEQNHKNGIYDFVEAVAFDKNDLVLSTGRFVNQVPYTHDYTRMRIYYQSILNRTTDYLTTSDYIWRWDTDWFWCSKVFGMQNSLMRLLFGKWCLNSRFYWKVMRFAHRNKLVKKLTERFAKPSESVIQDVAIPFENALSFFDFFTKEIGIKPFWMCPIIPYDEERRYPFFNLEPNKLYINFGFWATVESEHEDGHYNRLVEQKVVALEGIKSLYSNAYYDQDEFWQIYDKDLYRQLK